MNRISRHDSRVVALSALFSYHVAGGVPGAFDQLVSFYPEFFESEPGSQGARGGATSLPNAAAAPAPGGDWAPSSYVKYARNLFLAAVSHLRELDELIESRSEDWVVARMPVVDRCILELALAEIRYAGDAPLEVVLDEAVNLAREYGTADSPAFVNGLLMGILRTMGREEESP